MDMPDLERLVLELNDKANKALQMSETAAATSEATGLRYEALKHALSRIIAPLLAATGTTTETLQHLRATVSSEALWLSMSSLDGETSDRLTTIVGNEFESILDGFRKEVEIA